MVLKKLISKVDIIKPSEIDAERILGSDTPENQIKKFIDLGAKLVIMTLGKDGAIVSNGVETITFETLAKEIVDTTGLEMHFGQVFIPQYEESRK